VATRLMAGIELSVIIPLGPDEALPEDLLSALPDRPGVERIVSACSPAPSDQAGLRWITGTSGRGRQLNRAADQARGGWLWFLHADSRIDPEVGDRVLRFIRSTDAVIGYCRLRFLDDGPPAVALNALGANWRSRLLGRPYGDQALCVPREAFRQLNGFREDLGRGEDLDFVVRARAAGLRTRCMGPVVETSARRYREHGWLRTTLAHHRAARRLIRDARSAARSTTS